MLRGWTRGGEQEAMCGGARRRPRQEEVRPKGEVDRR